MVENSITDVFVPMLEKCIIIPLEIINFANTKDIYIPHYAEVISNAFKPNITPTKINKIPHKMFLIFKITPSF